MSSVAAALSTHSNLSRKTHLSNQSQSCKDLLQKRDDTQRRAQLCKQLAGSLFNKYGQGSRIYRLYIDKIVKDFVTKYSGGDKQLLTTQMRALEEKVLAYTSLERPILMQYVLTEDGIPSTSETLSTQNDEKRRTRTAAQKNRILGNKLENEHQGDNQLLRKGSNSQRNSIFSSTREQRQKNNQQQNESLQPSKTNTNWKAYSVASIDKQVVGTEQKNENQKPPSTASASMRRQSVATVPYLLNNQYHHTPKYRYGADEWAELVRFDTRMFEREQESKKKREAAQKVQLKEELERQRREKEGKRAMEQEEERAFAAMQQQQLEVELEKEKEKEEKRRYIQERGKQELHQQLALNAKLRRAAEREEKRAEQYYVQQFQADLQNDQQRGAEKRAREQKTLRAEMQAEQEERQRRLAAEAALREGEKRLEDKFGVILEDLEKKRKANEQQQREKQLLMMEKWENARKIFVQGEDPLAREEQRVQRYIQLSQEHEKHKDALAKAARDKVRSELRASYQQFVKSKNEKQQKEKALDQLQAKLWKEDTEEYEALEKNRKDMIQKARLENLSALKQQIQEKELQKQLGNRQMSVDELLQNYRILDKAKQEQQFAKRDHFVVADSVKKESK